MIYTNADQFTPSKKSELLKLIENKQPHLIAITEVKLKNGDDRKEQDYSLKNFLLYSTNIGHEKGRGIIILIHISIASSVLQIQPLTEYEEACLLEVKLNKKDVMIFGCFYRSPTKSISSENNNINLNILVNTLALNKRYSHLCLVGDFNYKDINWENWSTPHLDESDEEKFIKALRDSFLYQHVLEPTRKRGTDKPSTLDLILTGEEAQVSDLEYRAPLGKSDHSVLSFSFNCYLEMKTAGNNFIYDKADYEAMRRELDASEWQEKFIQKANNTNVEESWKDLKANLLALRNKYVPRKQEEFWKNKGEFPASYELRRLIKHKRRAHRKWIKSRNKEYENKERKRYNKIRNQVTKSIVKAKKDYERSICSQSNNNPKIFWKYIRDNLRTKTGIHPLLQSPKDQTSIKYDNKEKAEILQDQFCNVFTKEPSQDLPEFAPRTEKHVEIDITVDIVRKEIKSLNINKSIGPDEISPRLIKELVNYISVPITIIMKKSLADGYLPKDWRLAIVSPIYKKGAKNLAENYRPISLTSIICRLMEKLLKCQIMNHLEQENLLSKKQYGFVNKRSTTTQLLNYLDFCAEAIANGNVVDAIYFDFAKAFDTVPHKRLLKKLQAYGIKNHILDWIKAFLTDRYQAVRVSDTLSDKRKVISGVPQGSVLGPLLFVLYINDLPEAVDSEVYLFADDTKIVNKVEDVQDAMKLQKDINALENWSKTWLLRFHPDKCHVLTLGKFDNIRHAHQYTLGDVVLEHVFSEKDLGVTFDSELTFEEHILNQVNKANSIVGLIRRSFVYLTPSLFRQLFIAFVRPHLEYAQVVWSPKFRKHSKLIENVQRRATKIVSACKHLPYENRLQRIKAYVH